MIGEITALIAVAPQRGARYIAEIGVKKLQKRERNAVGQRPTVGGALSLDGEELLHIPGDKQRARAGGRAEAKAGSAVGVDLQIEVALIVAGGEEKLHAAVFTHLLQLTGQLGALIRLLRVLTHIEKVGIVAHLLPHTHAGITQPLDIVHGQARELRPHRRFGVDGQDRILTHYLMRLAAASSTMTVTSGWNCRMEAGTMGVTGPTKDFWTISALSLPVASSSTLRAAITVPMPMV